jgi:iron complex transport system permease protein
MLLVAVLLAAMATSAAGPIEFVGLAAPQIALRLAKVAQPPLLTSAIVGAMLTVGCDLIARTAFGVELPVGVVTAVLGGLYLIFLIIRRRKETRS